MEWSNKYGPIFRFSAGFRARAAVLCTDPKVIARKGTLVDKKKTQVFASDKYIGQTYARKE